MRTPLLVRSATFFFLLFFAPPLAFTEPAAPLLPDLDVSPAEKTAEVSFEGPRAEFDVFADVDPDFGPVRKFQLTRSLEITGAGPEPFVRSPAGYDLRTPGKLLGQLLEPGMSGEEKALRVCRFIRENCAPGNTLSLTSPDELGAGQWLDWYGTLRKLRPGGQFAGWFTYLRALGAEVCGGQSHMADVLFRAAGMPARVWYLYPPPDEPRSSHTVNEVFYDGAWHYFDVSYQGVYLNEAGRIASLKEVSGEPWVMERDPSYVGEELDYVDGDYSRTYWSERRRALFENIADDEIVEYSAVTPRDTLKPYPRGGHAGESIVMRWDSDPRDWSGFVKFIPEYFNRYPYFASPRFRGLFGQVEFIWKVDPAASPTEAVSMEAVSIPRERPDRFVKDFWSSAAEIVYEVRTPRIFHDVIVNGELELPSGARGFLLVSFDGGASYSEVQQLPPGAFEVRLNQRVEGKVHARCKLRLTGFWSRAMLKNLVIRTLEPANPAGLPALRAGRNRVTYEDRGPARGTRRLKYTYVSDLRISFSDNEPRSGDMVRITGKVANAGGAASEVPVEFRLNDPAAGTLIGRTVIPEILPGAAAEAAVDWDTRGVFGVQDVFMIVDPAQSIDETSRGNNTVYKSVAVRRGPWLHVPPSFLRFEGREAVLNISCRGDDACRNVRVRFYRGYPFGGEGPFAEKELTYIEHSEFAEMRAPLPADLKSGDLVGVKVLLENWEWNIGRRLGQPPVEAAERNAVLLADFKFDRRENGAALFDTERATIWAAPRPGTPEDPVFLEFSWSRPTPLKRVRVRYDGSGNSLAGGRFQSWEDGRWREIELLARQDAGIFTDFWLDPRPANRYRFVIDGPSRSGKPARVRGIGLFEDSLWGARPAGSLPLDAREAPAESTLQ